MSEIFVNESPEEMVSITFKVKKSRYDQIVKAQKEAEFDFLSEFMRGVIDVMFNCKFSTIQPKDLSWTKYLYAVGIGAGRMVTKFKETNPEDIETLNYLKTMCNGIENLINSVAYAESFELPVETEGLYVDALNLFYNWLDQNNLDEYKIKWFAEKIKQTYKYNK